MHTSGPISLEAHAPAEPLIAVVFVAAPYVLVLLTGLTTRWRLVVMGVLELGATVMTRGNTDDDFANELHPRRRPGTAR